MKAKLNKILSVVITLCMVVGMLPGVSLTAFAETVATAYATGYTWKSDKISNNLIKTPNLPGYSLDSGEDIDKWKNNWNNYMLANGWGSNYISNDDDSLQVYKPEATDTFAIRPTTKGVDSGSNANNACLGGAGDAPNHYIGGVSYTIALTEEDRAIAKLAAAGTPVLKTGANAEFYREKGEEYYFAVTFDQLDANGNKIGGIDSYTQNKRHAKNGEEDGYLSISDTYEYTLNAKTCYVCYWFSNYGTGNDRKAIKNFQAYLVKTKHAHYICADSDCTEHNAAAYEMEWSGSNSTSAISTDANIVLTGNTTLTNTLEISSGVTVNLCLNGKTLDLGSNYIENNGVLTICDCQSEQGTIKGANNTYGAIHNSGTVNVYGGNIKASNKYGIYNHSAGSVTVTGGTVTGDTGIYSWSTGPVTISGGTVTGEIGLSNYSTGSVTVTSGSVTGSVYYGIFNYSTAPVTISGGTVTGNTAKENVNGSGIFNEKAKVTVTDGTVKGYYGIWNNTTIAINEISGGTIIGEEYALTGVSYLSGTPKIEGSVGDIYIGSQSALAGYAESSDGRASYNGDSLAVYINSSNISSLEGDAVIQNVTPANKDKFILTNEGYELKLGTGENENNLVLAEKLLHKHDGITFTEWTAASGNLTSGDYYLKESNATALTGAIIIPAGETVTLCLDGKTLDMGSNYIDVEDGAEFNICDCQSASGKITGTHSYQTIFNRGTGSVTVLGGTIADTKGGGIRNYSTGSVTVKGGTVTGTTYGIANCGGGTVYLSGNPDISGNDTSYADLYLEKGTIYAESSDSTSAYTGDTLTIKLQTSAIGDVVVNNVTNTNKDKFTVTNSGYYLKLVGDDLVLTDELPHTHDDVTFTEWTETDSLPTTAGNYCLAKDVTLTKQWVAPVGDTKLCLNGHTITQEKDDAVLSVYNGETLSIYDCGTGGKITHAEGAKGQGVYIENATFNLYSGAIEGNKSESMGGGVLMSGGTFNMFGGSITDNETTTYSGGGVCVSGEFNMSGGSITGNKAERYGGGICHSSGTITVSGKVVIKDNYKTDGTTLSNLYFPPGQNAHGR